MHRKDCKWSIVCRDDADDHIARKICQRFGFNEGRNVGPEMFEYSLEQFPFGLTHLKCLENSTGGKDCEGIPADQGIAPCFPGDELAIACYNELLDSDIIQHRVEIKKRRLNPGYVGRFILQHHLVKKGIEVDTLRGGLMVLLNININETAIPANMLDVIEMNLRYRRSYWRLRKAFKSEPICLVALSLFPTFQQSQVLHSRHTYCTKKDIEDFLSQEYTQYIILKKLDIID